jgi:hypothetical protein
VSSGRGSDQGAFLDLCSDPTVPHEAEDSGRRDSPQRQLRTSACATLAGGWMPEVHKVSLKRIPEVHPVLENISEFLGGVISYYLASLLLESFLLEQPPSFLLSLKKVCDGFLNVLLYGLDYG